MCRYCLLFTLLLASFSYTFSQSIDHWETVVFAEDTWQYFPGKSEPPVNWNALEFDAEGWPEGKGGIGFGDGDDKTVIPPTSSLYIRKKFTIHDVNAITSILLHMDYDDAFVAYINGEEVARNGLTGSPPAFNQLAFINHEAQMYKGLAPEQFLLNDTLLRSHLNPDDNVIAIQVHNGSTTSSDLSAIVFLSLGINNKSSLYRAIPAWFKEPFAGFKSSNLPIVLITTDNGSEIVDEPKTKASLKVIDNGSRNQISDTSYIYNGEIGIEIRGHYSAALPQKPYALETRDSLGENRNVPFWNMPKENDWILLANYNDKTFMRNSMAFHLFNKMGHYAPRSRLCEVVLNKDYQGIYLFTEKIKQDKGRVDIAKLDSSDLLGDQLSGGYIFKVDYSDGNDHWDSKYYPTAPDRNVYFVYHDPALKDMPVEQAHYLETFVDSYEVVLYSENFKDPLQGYKAFIDLPSFVDYFLMTEITRNVDGYKKSKYYSKDQESKGGLIHSGPVWDFDWSMKDRNQQDLRGEGWIYKTEFNRPNPDGWIIRLMKDPMFANEVHNRYYELRQNILHLDYLYNFMDSVHTLVEEAQGRHYTKWDILGKAAGTPIKGDIPETYEGEVDALKAFMERRLNWLDKEMANFYTPGLDTKIEGSPKAPLRQFPNPAHEQIYIEDIHQMQHIRIYNSLGKLVLEHSCNNLYSVQMDVSMLQTGVYFAQITCKNKLQLSSKFIKH